MKKFLKRVLSVILVISMLFTTGAVVPLRAAAASNLASSVNVGQTYMIRNAATGLYMTALGDNTVEQRAFTGANNQQWKTFNELSSIWKLDGLDIRPLSNLDVLLDMENNQSDAYVNVRDARDGFFDAPSNQMWEFINYNNGSFQIKSARNDRIIGLNGNRTMMRNQSSNMDRRWEFVEAGRVTYNYTTNGGSGSNFSADFFEGQSVNLSHTSNKNDATFLGWHTNPTSKTALSSLTMGSENITLYAIFRDKQTVTYNAQYNGGNEANRTAKFYSGEAVDVSLTTFPATKTNAEFLGWNTNYNATTHLTSYTMPDSPLMLYAIFRNKMQVTYNANGGALTDKSSDWFFPGDNVDLTPAASKDNAKFLGWHTDPNETTPLSSYAMPSAACTLYAIYEEKETVTYNYTYNGGTRPADQFADARFFADETIAPLPDAADKTDAKFLGWNTDPDAAEPLTSFPSSPTIATSLRPQRTH